MSNNQNFIALHGGKECRPVNPFKKHTFSNDENPDFTIFEETNPTFPLTEVMPEGEVFSGISEWRYNSPDTGWTPTALESTLIFKAQCGFEVKEFIKPLKSKEPAHPIEEAGEITQSDFDYIKNRRVDVVENKETVEEAVIKHFTGTNVPADIRELFMRGAIFGANWQQSQSIEGIVGFVLEWVAKNVDTTPDGDYDGNGDYINRERVDTDGILNMKSDIINEYNNGK